MKCTKCHFENPEDTLYCGKCASPLQSPGKDEFTQAETFKVLKKELTTGTTFAGRYQIIEEIGKGGMGKVYKVLDKEINNNVALKLIKPEIAADEKTIERFRNELKTARDIAHKNVCRMYDLNKEEGSYYITMEYVHGEDLKRLIRKMGQMSAGQIISIAKQVCEGLSEAHRLGVVHRDLKPQNIMVDEDGSARIMDFGIARSIKAKDITDKGVIIGTPEYMSPEQVEGKGIDHRSDIYSLGIILYEMVTGRVPFEGDTPLSVAMKHKSEIPKDPKELNPQIPGDLSLLILKCMEKKRSERYQSVEELLLELKNVEEKLPTTEKVITKRKPLTSKEITVKLTLKRLFIPAALVVVLVIIGVILWLTVFKKELPPLAPAPRSVAVLPFIDLSAEKDHEWLSDGISEAMITALSSLKGLRVPARTSSFSFKGKEVDIQEIGQKLKVENVLEGSVQVVGVTLRVNAQLISVKDGYHLWSDKYDRKLEDLFSIQDEIAREVARALKVRLLGEEETQLSKKYTENLEAYSLYVRGRYFWNKRNKEDLYKSIEFFEKSLEEDPNYVLAYAGLADSYYILGNNEFIAPGEAYPKARKYVLKALEMDNRLAEAHATLASIKRDYDWDWTGAEKEFKIALQLNPGYGHAHHWYAFLLSDLGRHEEAIKEIKMARDLDPLAPRIAANVGHLLYKAREYDEALEELGKAIELYPDHTITYGYVLLVYLAQSRYEEALHMIQELEKYGTGVKLTILKAQIYAKWGKKKEAEKLLKIISEETEKIHISPAWIASIYGFLGDYDRAYSLLDKAYSERDPWLSFLIVTPIFDSLRSDPRFKNLLKKMNLD